MKFLPLVLLCLFFVSCGLGGSGIPEDKKDYVGIWVSENMTLNISPQGKVEYKKQVGANSSKSVKGPIQKFEGDNFVVGALGINTIFVVSEKPHETDGVTKMTVDGVELVKQY